MNWYPHLKTEDAGLDANKGGWYADHSDNIDFSVLGSSSSNIYWWCWSGCWQRRVICWSCWWYWINQLMMLTRMLTKEEPAHNIINLEEILTPSAVMIIIVTIIVIIIICTNNQHQHQCYPYLIFVTSINIGASVIFLTEGYFSQWNRKLIQYSVCILHTVCNFTHGVYVCTQVVILHTVCNLTHSVKYYAQVVVLHTQCVILHKILIHTVFLQGNFCCKLTHFWV